MTHYEIAREALDAGLHVLIEKPMTVRAADAIDLDARARAAGLELVVGYTNNFAPGVIAARALVQRGELGEITLVAGLFTSSLEEFLMGRPGEETDYARLSPIGGPGTTTYSDPARSGGGQGQSQATHALGALAYITGLRPRRVSALMHDRGAAVDVIDAMVFELDNGAIGTLAASGAIGVLQAEQQEQHYYGTLGTLHHDFITGAVTLRRARAASRAALSPEGQSAEASVAAPLDCLVDRILGRGENHGPAAVGIAAVELLEAAYRSAAADGAPIAIAR